MPLFLVREDITRMKVDAIVNAANSALAPGGGVCGAIFAAAGYKELDRACRAIGGCPTGQAVITPGFKLPAKYIVHTAGPIWQGGSRGEAEQLYACYQNSLKIAKENGCGSITFPLISSGIYGYPKQEAFRVAQESVRAFLEETEMDVYLSVLDREIVFPDEKG